MCPEQPIVLVLCSVTGAVTPRMSTGERAGQSRYANTSAAADQPTKRTANERKEMETRVLYRRFESLDLANVESIVFAGLFMSLYGER